MGARAKIVAIDDDDDILALVEAACGSQHHLVTLVQDSRVALSTIRATRPDIVLLDMQMPDVSGAEICREIRSDAELLSTWVLMLSALNTEEQIVEGLDAGADDYLTKPFGLEELNARIRSALRRRAGAGTEPGALRVGPLSIDEEGFTVALSGQPLDLTAAEFRLLTHLAKNPSRVFSRNALVGLISGSRSDTGPRTIDAHVRSVRGKLGDQRHLVETVRGVGYRWCSAC